MCRRPEFPDRLGTLAAAAVPLRAKKRRACPPVALHRRPRDNPLFAHLAITRGGCKTEITAQQLPELSCSRGRELGGAATSFASEDDPGDEAGATAVVVIVEPADDLARRIEAP